MKTSFEARAGLSSLLFLALLLGAFACAFSANISPLTFGNDATDDATWQRLVKYKLWATGQDGIEIHENAYIPDTKGYVGSAKGGLAYHNDNHVIGGPLIFAGVFAVQNGHDTIISGPSRFSDIAYRGGSNNNWNSNIINGNFCLGEGGSCPSVIPVNQCSCDDVPDVDANLRLPTVNENFNKYDLVINSISKNNDIAYIDVPEGDGPYNIHITGNVTLVNESHLLIRMPYGGRSTRIIVDGNFTMSSTSHIRVMYAGQNDRMSSGKWPMTGLGRAATLEEYAGHLLFYLKKGLTNQSLNQDVFVEGTFIIPGLVTVMQHFNFAGQILADKIIISSNFNSKFLYVPFEGAKVVAGYNMGILEEGGNSEEVQFRLDKKASNGVSFKYCFEFSEKDSATVKNTAKEDTTWAHRSDIANVSIPVCGGKYPFEMVSFAAGSTTPEKPVKLEAFDDQITENTEYFNIKIWEMSGASLSNGQVSGTFRILIKDNDGRAAGDNVTIHSDPNKKIGIEDIPFAITSFPAYSSSDGKTRGPALKDYKVKITSLPAKGSLMYDEKPVSVNTVIESSNLKAGRLTYRSNQDDYGDTAKDYAYTDFTFKIMNVNDSISVDSYKMSLCMMPDNDAPQIKSPVSPDNKFVVDEDTKIGFVFATALATDVDMVLDPNATISYSLEKISISGYGNAVDVVKIDPKTGELSISSELDYNKENSYVGVVVATDNGVPGNRKDTKVAKYAFYLTVNEIRHEPEIICNPYVAYVTEHSPLGTTVMEFKATDKNRNDLLKLTFRIESENKNDPFPFNFENIDLHDSVRLYVDSVVDYETMPHRYDIRVIVSDNVDPTIALYDTARVTIFLKDTNEAPIVRDTVFKIRDSKPAGESVGFVVASDADIKAKDLTETKIAPTVLTYKMGKILDITDNNKDMSAKFTMNEKTGEISLKSALSADLQKHVFETEVTVTDNGSEQKFCMETFDSTKIATDGTVPVKDSCVIGKNLSSVAVVRISIPEENYVPEINPNYEFDIEENSPEFSIVGRVKGTDKNPFDILTYSIVDEDKVPFEIKYDASTDDAYIRTKQGIRLDFESVNKYTFDVIVSDYEASAMSHIVVNVLDVNEKPKIVRDEFRVNENAAIGTQVALVEVNDVDTWTVMSYKLVDDSVPGVARMFNIAPASAGVCTKCFGKITVNTLDLNYEQDSVYVVKVIATDNGKEAGFPPSLSDTASIVIRITDINDTPVFKQDLYEFTVDENTPEDTLVGQVEADDEDNKIVKKNNLTYTIVDITKDAHKYFKINKVTGEITTTDVALDYETLAFYEFKAVVTDDGVPNLSDTTIVKVTVRDVNEKPTIADVSMKVAEWDSIGKVLGTVTSGDLDTASKFKKHKYEAIGGDTLLFAIDAVTGKVSVRDTIFDPDDKIVDATKGFGYRLNIRVVDISVANNLLYADGIVKIALEHVNDPPKIDSATYYISEKSPEGTYVGRIGATDDRDPYDALTFEIVGNSNEFEFSEKGILSVKAGAVLDYEICNGYTIEVRVTDMDGASSKKSFNIFVRDVNEPPEFVNTEFHVDENSKGGTSVGVITASDPDVYDTADKLVFELDSGFVSDEFEVMRNGEICVKAGADLDYEKVQVYTLKVRVTDTQGAFAVGEVTIFVDNLNEKPVFEKDEFHVPENSPKDTKVGVLVAHDEEDDDSELIYGLSEPSNEFEVSKTGEITVKNGANLDYETKHEYIIKVYVRDTEGGRTEGSFKIHIDDVREVPTLADTTLHVKENVPTGTKVGVLVADNPEKDTLKYELITKSDKFKVKEDGTILTIGSIDYEAQKEYKLKVVVHGNNCADTANVVIKVDNVVEIPDVVITRAEHKDSVWIKPKEIFTNVEDISVEWTVNGKFQPDTLVHFPKDSTYKIIVKYEDPTMDAPGADTLIVHVNNSIPKVTIKKSDEDSALVNGLTIVEQVDEGDTNYYVNKNANDLVVRVKDGAMGIDTSYNLHVNVDSLIGIRSSVNAISEIAKENITLADTASALLSRTKLGKDKIAVSFEKEIGKRTVKVTYYTDKKGKLLKNDNGEVVMDVVYSTFNGGKDLDFTFHVNGKNGKKIEGVYGGVYEVSYTYRDSVNKQDLGVRYGIDKDGQIVKNEEGNYGFQVSYTYTNVYGNTASKSISIVVDKVLPVVKIVSPENHKTVHDRGLQVEWTVDGETQDTLTLQALKNGLNAIVRIYRDKAGNEVGDSVLILLKNPKDMNISLIKPVTIIKEGDLEEYYDVNPPKKGESFAVSVYDRKKGHEVETIIGGSFKNKKGSMEEPYKHSNDKHFGPTLGFEALTQRCGDKPAGGLCTLDDVIEADGKVSLEAGGSRDRKRVSVSEYVDEYCTDEFRKNYKNDPTRAPLFHTTMNVKIWIYSNQADFLDYYKFEQDLDNPDYVDEVGVVNSYFELKPDVNGNLVTSEGRLVGTGAYIFRAEASITSKVLCDMPSNKRGDKIRSKDSMLKNFGYKRPNKRIEP